MGGNNSKEDNNNWRQNSSVRSSSSASSWGSYPDPQSGYGHGGYAYEPQQPSYPTQQPYYAQPPPPPPNYGNEPQPHASGRVAGHRNEKRLDRKYSRITDNYNSIDEVRDALVVGDVLLCLTLACHGIKSWLFLSGWALKCFSSFGFVLCTFIFLINIIWQLRIQNIYFLFFKKYFGIWYWESFILN